MVCICIICDCEKNCPFCETIYRWPIPKRLYAVDCKNYASRRLFEDLIFSRNGIARRIENIGKDISKQLSWKAEDFQCFSLAYDESADITDTAQILVFVRGVTKYLSVFENLHGLVSVCSTIPG